jgi:hypothetical protein
MVLVVPVVVDVLVLVVAFWSAVPCVAVEDGAVVVLVDVFDGVVMFWFDGLEYWADADPVNANRATTTAE